eukprot:5161023-Prymnesium_polylepis.1
MIAHMIAREAVRGTHVIAHVLPSRAAAAAPGHDCDLVARTHLIDSWADEPVLKVVVQLDHATQRRVASAGGLVHELVSAREYHLHVGGHAPPHRCAVLYNPSVHDH